MADPAPGISLLACSEITLKKKSHLYKLIITVFTCNLFPIYEILILEEQKEANIHLHPKIATWRNTKCAGLRGYFRGGDVINLETAKRSTTKSTSTVGPLKNLVFLMGKCQENQWYKFHLQKYSQEGAMGTSKLSSFFVFLLEFTTCSVLPVDSCYACGEIKMKLVNFLIIVWCAWFCLIVPYFLKLSSSSFCQGHPKSMPPRSLGISIEMVQKGVKKSNISFLI